MYMDYTEIGRRIAQKRRKLLLTQAEVEAKADLSPRYLSNIERGRSIPSIDVAWDAGVCRAGNKVIKNKINHPCGHPEKHIEEDVFFCGCFSYGQ